jgi:hypothetical protein
VTIVLRICLERQSGTPDAYGTTAADEALDIPNDNSRAGWDEFVAKINASLDNLDLEFRHLHDELTGRAMYALVRCPILL